MTILKTSIRAQVVEPRTETVIRNDGGIDPTGTTDSTAGLQAAIDDAGATGGAIQLPAGRYLHTGLTIAKNFTQIVGVGGPGFGATGVQLVYNGAVGGDWITVDNVSHVTIQNIGLTVSPSVTLTGGRAVYAKGLEVSRLNIRDCRVDRCWNGIEIDGISFATIADTLLMVNGRGEFGVRVSSTTSRVDNFHIRDVIVQTGIAGGSPTCIGLDIQGDVNSVFCAESGFLKCKHGVWVHSDGVNTPALLRFNATAAESCYSDGYRLDDCFHAWLVDGYANLNSGNGIYLAGSAKGIIELRGMTASVNDHNGVLSYSNGRVMHTSPRYCNNSQGTTNTYYGLRQAAGTEDWHVLGGRMGGDVHGNPAATPKQRAAIYIPADCNNFTIIGTDVRTNVTATIADNTPPSATKHIIGTLGHTG